MAMIETATYRMQVSACGRHALVHMASRWWWILALPLAVLLVAGFGNWVWWMAALMLCCIAYPMLLMLGYYWIALSPDGAKAILPQKAEISDKGILITYFPYDEGCAAPAPRSIPMKGIGEAYLDGKTLVINIKQGLPLRIPAEAIPDLEKAMQLLSISSHRLS